MQCSKTKSEFGCGHPECSLGCIYPAFEHPKSSKLLLERRRIDHTIPEADKTIGLEVCKCGSKRRGPMGGVCGNCGQAIPSQQEIEFHKII